MIMEVFLVWQTRSISFCNSELADKSSRQVYCWMDGVKEPT